MTLQQGSRRAGAASTNREHAWVYMLNVNVHDLPAWNRVAAAADRLFGLGSAVVPSLRYGVRVFEDWGGSTLTYRGSFVSLGTPRHDTGTWCGTGSGCNIYNPPARNWDYDTDFQDVANLPPLTPRFVAVEQILFTENFR